jgi:hypothetical protein
MPLLQQELPAEKLSGEDLQAQFQRTFTNNLRYLEAEHPALYAFAISHTPKDCHLAISDAGYPTILRASDESQLTGDDPEQQVSEYLAEHMKKPEYILAYGQDDFSREKIPGNTCMSPYLEALQACVPHYAKPYSKQKNTFVPLAICFGQGLGHITRLLPKHYDIQHLIIYEPNLDCFYTSLFVQDFRALAAPFEGNNKSITFALGDNPEKLCNSVFHLVQDTGYFILANTLLFEPFPCERASLAKKRYRQLAHRMKFGWGYFSDEFQGLTQTLENCSRGLTLLDLPPQKTKLLANVPCCVVGNGPSLDTCIEFLKAHQDSLLILSAGTTLHTLLKHGIKPDLQIEIERTEGTHTHLSPLAEQGLIADIPLITLNTISPDVPQLFQRVFSFLKEGDLGGEALLEHQLCPNATLTLTHPLVGNGAAAIAVRLGVKTILLMGMDLCVADTGLIHSADSIYNTPGAPLQEHQRAFKYVAGGNLGGTVRTDQLYDNSRLSMEFLIEAHQECRFINISRGIHIRGAKPLANPSSITVRPAHNKKALLEDVLSNTHYIKLNKKTEKDIINLAAQRTHSSIDQLKQLLWGRKTADIASVYTSFCHQTRILEHSKRESIIPYRFLKGSLAQLQIYILYCLTFSETPRDRTLFLDKARKMLQKYLNYTHSTVDALTSSKD